MLSACRPTCSAPRYRPDAFSAAVQHHRRCHSPSSSPRDRVVPATWVATRTMRRLPPTMCLPPSARLANTLAASCRSRPLTTLGSRPSGGDSQTRPVRPTSPAPPLTDVPASQPAALGLGTRLPFCAPLRATTERMHHPEPEGRSSHHLRWPQGESGRRTPRASPLAGPPGLAWSDPLCRRRTSWDQDGSFRRGCPRFILATPSRQTGHAGLPSMTGNSHDFDRDQYPLSVASLLAPNTGWQSQPLWYAPPRDGRDVRGSRDLTTTLRS
jgi:hypothetical protein